MTRYDEEIRESRSGIIIEFGFVLKWLYRKLFGIPKKSKPAIAPERVCGICKRETKIFMVVIDPGVMDMNKENVILVCSRCVQEARNPSSNFLKTPLRLKNESNTIKNQ
jgi:hypothetical protein